MAPHWSRFIGAWTHSGGILADASPPLRRALAVRFDVIDLYVCEGTVKHV